MMILSVKVLAVFIPFLWVMYNNYKAIQEPTRVRNSFRASYLALFLAITFAALDRGSNYLVYSYLIAITFSQNANLYMKHVEPVLNKAEEL